jgi:hypothetical protein
MRLDGRRGRRTPYLMEGTLQPRRLNVIDVEGVSTHVSEATIEIWDVPEVVRELSILALTVSRGTVADEPTVTREVHLTPAVTLKGSETPITFAQQLDRRSRHPKTPEGCTYSDRGPDQGFPLVPFGWS